MIAFDIGGTFIKYAIFNEAKEILAKGKFATPCGSEITSKLAEEYLKAEKEYGIKGIGVSTAGFVNADSGEILYSANIPNYTGVNIIEELSEKTGQNVVVDNDVTACLYNFSTDNCLYIAVGTGIGGGLITANDVFRGAAYSEMEIGHMHLRAGKSFEALCSTRALLNEYTVRTNTVLTGEELDLKYQDGDETVHQLINDYMDDFGLALMNLVYILDPKEIIIGGGVSEAKMFNIDVLKEKFTKHCTMLAGRTIEIKRSPFKNDAAFLGIAAKYYQIYQ